MPEPTPYTESNVLLAVLAGDTNHARELISRMFEMQRLNLRHAAGIVRTLVEERDAEVTGILRQAALEHQREATDDKPDEAAIATEVARLRAGGKADTNTVWLSGLR
jgi:hypothetical protein